MEFTGNRYDSKLSIKEIAQNVRTFVKKEFPDYKFSVRTFSAGTCDELRIAMKEAPCGVFKSYDEMTEKDINDCMRKVRRVWSLNSWTKAEEKAEFERIWEESPSCKCVSDDIKAVAKAVDEYANSFNFSSRDEYDAYADIPATVNFYFFGCLQDPVSVEVR